MKLSDELRSDDPTKKDVDVMLIDEIDDSKLPA